MKNRIWLISVLLTALSGCEQTDETYMVGTLERDRVEHGIGEPRTTAPPTQFVHLTQLAHGATLSGGIGWRVYS